MTEYLVEGSLATILIKNEENKLSKIYKNLLQNIQKAKNDSSVKSIIIIGQKSFTNQHFPLELYDEEHHACLIDILSEIENSLKPIIAAIDNYCVGDGLEIAISCHYRITQSNTWFCFPEVNLGIIPQATGTQRLPRLSSLRFALDVIPSGRFFSAEEALTNNVVDKIVDSKTYEKAKIFAKQVEGKGLEERRTSKRQVIDRNKLDELVLLANGKILDYPLNKACKYSIQAVAASVKPFDQGKMIEKLIFSRLFSSAQSKGLRYSHSVEKSSSKWKLSGGADWMNTKEDQINYVAIIGCDKKAIEIALGFMKSDIPVVIFDERTEISKSTIQTITDRLNDAIKQGNVNNRITNSLFTITNNMKNLKNSDIVFINVEGDIVQDALSKIDPFCKPRAIFAILSAVKIDEVAFLTKRQSFIIGFHLFESLHLSRLIQIVYSSETFPKTISTILEAGRLLNKVPLLLKSPLQIANQNLINSMKNMINNDHIKKKDEENEIVRDFHKENIINKQSPSDKLMICKNASTCDNMDFEKLLGLTNDEDKRKKTSLITEVTLHEEVTKWYLYNSINESFVALENGSIEKPEDIDLILLFGFNFPRQIGGIMKYTDEKGPRKIYDEICKYQEMFYNRKSLKPSKLLKRIALENIPMNLWSPTARSTSRL